MEGEGVEQAEGVFGYAVFEEVSVDVEGVVAIVVADEGVDECELVDEYDRQREQEQIGGQRVSRDIYPLEEVADGGQVLSQSDRQVHDAEKRKVEQLVGVECHLVVRVIPKNQSSAVEEVGVKCEEGDGADLEFGLFEDQHFVGEEYPDDGKQVCGEGLWREDHFFVVGQHAIDDEVQNPDNVVLPDEDSDKRDEAEPPLALGQVVVEHCGYHRDACCVGVV